MNEYSPIFIEFIIDNIDLIGIEDTTIEVVGSIEGNRFWIKDNNGHSFRVEISVTEAKVGN